jgi:transcriptional regulator with GAF, ATPase, and Fis domain
MLSELNNSLAEVEMLKDRLEAENIYLQDEIKHASNFEEIIGNNRRFLEVLRSVEQVAKTDATVLILGETGTGKELVARAVHSSSRRSDHPLVKVNCAALPSNLIESELFGHEKGAFTGAVSRRIGRFELADGGTIFLDEVAELPLELQAKLLRVIQEGEFERLGNTHTTAVDVRVIAATNRDIQRSLKDGTFREDLYYRLNVFPIYCPPLRDRVDDLPILVNHFVSKYCAKIGREVVSIPTETMRCLTEYHWPGNVRELENIIERAVVLSPGGVLEVGDWFQRSKPKEHTSEAEAAGPATLEEKERAYIVEVLKRKHWKIRGAGGAAEALGLKPTTLESRMKKLGITR